jgi:hypothetical protein
MVAARRSQLAGRSRGSSHIAWASASTASSPRESRDSQA